MKEVIDNYLNNLYNSKSMAEKETLNLKDPDLILKRIIIMSIIFGILSFLLISVGQKGGAIAVGIGGLVSIIIGIIYYILVKNMEISSAKKLATIPIVFCGLGLIVIGFFQYESGNKIKSLLNIVLGIALIIVNIRILKKH